MRPAHLLFSLWMALYPIQSFCDYSDVEYQKALARVSAEKELYFSFPVKEVSELDAIGPMVSLDKVEGLKVYAYANKKEFEAFTTLNREFTVEINPGDSVEVECSDYKDIRGLPYFTNLRNILLQKQVE